MSDPEARAYYKAILFACFALARYPVDGFLSFFSWWNCVKCVTDRPLCNRCSTVAVAVHSGWNFVPTA